MGVALSYSTVCMPDSCSSCNCQYRYKKGNGVSQHHFPHTDPDLLAKWVEAIRRDKWVPTKSICLCSAHFSPDCFIPGRKKKCLKKGTVPSISTFPSHLHKTETKRKSAKRRHLVEDQSEKEVPPLKVIHTIAAEHNYIWHQADISNKVVRLQKKVYTCFGREDQKAKQKNQQPYWLIYWHLWRKGNWLLMSKGLFWQRILDMLQRNCSKVTCKIHRQKVLMHKGTMMKQSSL